MAITIANGVPVSVTLGDDGKFSVSVDLSEIMDDGYTFLDNGNAEYDGALEDLMMDANDHGQLAQYEEYSRTRDEVRQFFDAALVKHNVFGVEVNF